MLHVSDHHGSQDRHDARVVVIGTGYVGLTTGACLASLGHRVVCADADSGKVERLSRGQVDILEPGLPELVADGLATGRLVFTGDTVSAVREAEVVFLCLPTPMGLGGAADLAAVEAVAGQVRHELPDGCVVANKSTVPVGTSGRVAALLGRPDVAVVSNPEFLREGRAVHDFLHPDRIVVGGAPEAVERVAALYGTLGAPLVRTDAASAELAKYAANFFLAMKLSFANNLATLCESFGADIADVTAAIGQDPRIGSAFLQPGPGWGGSCLPKDTHALLSVCEAAGIDFPLLRATIDTNVAHQERLVERVVADLVPAGGSPAGARLALFGLTFKAGTSDLRDSPALAVARALRDLGIELVAYDPALSATRPDLTDLLTLADDPLSAADGAAACLILTEWPEFRDLDWEAVAARMDGRTVHDFRNLLDPDRLERAGLVRQSIGRPYALTG
ncbi:UDP-glucose/GDP-mannose dehydrogenase family protein [Streptomyces sp. LP05-1]|uniref:UDP-glucose 6-dehydrogenase n=1 Tax=Streptomyces pyxinae TaxID=2970734 RepID=A0ABT2CBJ1_9ACTN|nr:UDP-glucose/GDP-mannose dehydrogenase family protein [Streptomyces sp. LP05-1]MCS0634767.1 UDP-glucose/GDP-mannose dehydrogenase family protein [Streptomyces sp. LP05-1]